MKYFVLALFQALRAPVNLSMKSVNFHHVLCWTPGSGTPAGAQYQIINRVKKKNTLAVQGINKTCSQLELNPVVTHNLSVRASYNHSTSPKSKPITFTPFTDTIIGPPKLSVAGCGNCIQINITMPEMDKTANISNLQFFNNPSFKISWKTAEGKQVRNQFLLKNLVTGTEYCLQVDVMINTNRNCKPSNWTCTFTSIVEPSRVPVVLGAVSTLLIVGGVVLMTLMVCLAYTGFICKVTNQPRALLVSNIYFVE
uniref:Fibronectin type-III domain-containing protein n=1 Tax=Myripristis murdjan TaxID=586833 RepID=A0A667ZA18_9TELE